MVTECDLFFRVVLLYSLYCRFFFFNDTAPTEIYTLSLHDALPISHGNSLRALVKHLDGISDADIAGLNIDRKSTRLNSSHQIISYAVFCLKKKKRHSNAAAERSLSRQVACSSKTFWARICHTASLN